MKNLVDFCSSLLENGGATFNLVMGTSPTKGYVVSEKGHESVSKLFGNGITREILVNSLVKQYIADNGFKLSIVDYNLGGWINKNKLYLDISIVYDNEQDAIEMAKKNGQLAYFDLSNGEERFI